MLISAIRRHPDCGARIALRPVPSERCSYGITQRRALFYLVCISVNSVRRHPVEHILYPGRIGKQLSEGLQFSGNVPSARDNGGNDAIILTQPALVRLVPSRNHAGDLCSIFRAHACTLVHLAPFI